MKPAPIVGLIVARGEWVLVDGLHWRVSRLDQGGHTTWIDLERKAWFGMRRMRLQFPRGARS